MRMILWLVMSTVLVLVGCSGDKEPAQEALKAGKSAIDAARDDAGRFVPEELAKMDSALKAAQDHFDNKRYSEALLAAKDLAAKGQALAQAASGRKEELTRRFEDINVSLPGLLESIQGRMEALGNTPPPGLDAAKFAEYKAQLPTLGIQLRDAVQASQSGDLPKAVDLAAEAQAKATEISQVIGASPAQ